MFNKRIVGEDDFCYINLIRQYSPPLMIRQYLAKSFYVVVLVLALERLITGTFRDIGSNRGQ